MADIKIGIIMGSKSDLPTMQPASDILKEFEIEHEVRIISAHRTPDQMSDYAQSAKDRGLKIIIAGAGGSAHLPGMTASHTLIPVIAVPIKSNPHDHEALWSNIKMPYGVPLATLPENGAKNAALMAIEILALNDQELSDKYQNFKQKLKSQVLDDDKNLTVENTNG